MKICFATNNQNKIKEVWQLLPPDFFTLSLAEIGCMVDLPETQNTFHGNALQKATYVYEHYGIPCFADDSGLAVNALQGAPGVFSARYAGIRKNDADNLNRVLKNLEGIIDRSAKFKTVIALVGLTEQPVFFEGEIAGSLITAPRGNDGFGYDPIFVPENHNVTFAEMTLTEKNKISHRGKAIKKLIEYLKGNSKA